jgi:hypothetical protein
VLGLGLLAFLLLFGNEGGPTGASGAAEVPRSGPTLRELPPFSLSFAGPPPHPPSSPQGPLAATAEPAASPYRFIWPAEGRLVQGLWAGHPGGIDIAANVGEPIRAVRDGTVVFAGGDPCCVYGLFVIVEHDEGWSSLYAHLSETGVQLGDTVAQGQVIALSGATGKLDGPHLHFELRSAAGRVDPLAYLEPRRSWAPSPDDFYALASKAQSPPPTPTSTPVPDAQMDAGRAVMLALSWFSQRPDVAYDLDAADCSAAKSGPYWWVTCNGSLAGCSTAACLVQLTACVFEQPVLVAESCR